MVHVLPRFFLIFLAFILFSSNGLDARMFKVTKKNYNKIEIGMTKEQVIKIIGKEPDSESKTYTEGFGTTELWQFLNWSGKKSITVIFDNGKVVDKYWIKH